MIIYSVLTTCTFDGEDFMLFTSLSKAVQYAQVQFDSAIQVMLPDEEDRDEDDKKALQEWMDEEYPNYKKVKAEINRDDEWNDYTWSGSINTYDSFYVNIKKHDSNNRDEYNSYQFGGF